MTTLGIYGASDDLVVIEVDGQASEELTEPSTIVLSAGTKALHVEVKFDDPRWWCIATSIFDDSEEGELPFLVRLGQRRRSPILLVDVRVPITMSFWRDGVLMTRAFR